MDEEIESPLRRQMLPLPVSSEAMQKASNSPEFQIHQKELTRLLVEQMVKQTHSCRWGSVFVTRERHVLKIEWKIYPGTDREEEDFTVTGFIDEISLIPDPNWISNSGLIIYKKGNGSMTLELEEGGAYQIRIMFSKMREADDIKAFKENVDDTNFLVAVPLSDESRAILRSTRKMESNPDERLRREFKLFTSKRDALDDERRVAIEKIKAKGLSPEEEDEQIADINDFARSVKDKFGI